MGGGGLVVVWVFFLCVCICFLGGLFDARENVKTFFVCFLFFY